MRIYIVIVILLFCNIAVAQTTYHGFFLGANYSAIGLDARTAGTSKSEYGTFKNPRIGYSVGYKFYYNVSPKVFFSTGATYKRMNLEFTRPYYNDPNWMIENFSNISENVELSRVLIPVNAYYTFINKENVSIYITTGAEIIFLNKIDRKADYYIPGPPTGYVKGTFEGKQDLKFDKGSIGIAAMGGIGTEFKINDKSFVIELSFSGDISKNKFYTLHNIEGDSYFYGKVKSYELKVCHTFALDFK